MEYFSERYRYKKPHVWENWEGLTPEVRTRLWNLFYKTYNSIGESNYNLLSKVWDKFFRKDVSKFAVGYGNSELCKWIYGLLNESAWYEIYDFVEFIWHEDSGRNHIWSDAVNQILSEERVPCRFIKGLVVPITNPAEIEEITKALDAEDTYKPAREHLEKALALLADREKLDFANSIKESISALESLAQILLGTKGTLGNLTKKLQIHPCFREGLNKLYGWTSDAGGIRHGKSGKEPEPSLADARFMLILVSAFFNYLISIYTPADNK